MLLSIFYGVYELFSLENNLISQYQLFIINLKLIYIKNTNLLQGLLI